MSELTFATQRGELQREREHLLEQLARLGVGQSGRLDFDEGFADSGQVTAERGEAEALAGNLQEQLAEVDDALAKLERGEYGRCESCGDEIAPDRLEAIPTARLCIRCASAAS